MTWKQAMVNFIIILIGLVSAAIFSYLGDNPDLTIGLRYAYFAGFVASLVIVLYSLYKASNEIFGDDDDLTPA